MFHFDRPHCLPLHRKGNLGARCQSNPRRVFEQIFLLAPDFAREKFATKKSVQFIPINDTKPMQELVKDIINQLQGRIRGTEVAVNFVSGSGKEHMALLAALLQLGLGIRFVAWTQDGLQEL